MSRTALWEDPHSSSGFKGGPPTDLKNMADCQEWKGQRFKKIYVRKITQHEESFFNFPLKE